MTTTLTTPSCATPADASARRTVAALEAGTIAPDEFDHRSFVLATVHLVRRHGQEAALDELRRLLADVGVPFARDLSVTGMARYHETLAAYGVWAAARLLGEGLDTLGILWHPLVAADSALAWYPREVLASEAAHATFVPSPLAGDAEPAPGRADAPT